MKIRNMLSSMRDSHNRNILQGLVIFLFILRSSNSNALIAAVMELNENCVRDSIHSVLESFRNDVLPKYFGVQAHTREFFLNQNSPVTDFLYNINRNTLVSICDSTYLRHEKSSNNYFQRKSYSGQKKTHLCKPFTICTANGYIVDVEGPFDGNMNDASILDIVLKDTIGCHSFLY